MKQSFIAALTFIDNIFKGLWHSIIAGFKYVKNEILALVAEIEKPFKKIMSIYDKIKSVSLKGIGGLALSGVKSIGSDIAGGASKVESFLGFGSSTTNTNSNAKTAVSNNINVSVNTSTNATPTDIANTAVEALKKHLSHTYRQTAQSFASEVRT